MSTKNEHLRFPSGMTAEQVGKDAKAIRNNNPKISHLEALDLAAQKHMAPGGYEAGLDGARRFADWLEQRGPQPPNIQYCVQCERPATVLRLGLPYCGYHGDIDREDADIPAYNGKIPEGANCFNDGCDAEPTKILGGVCFCKEHYAEAKSGARRRRTLGW